MVRGVRSLSPPFGCAGRHRSSHPRQAPAASTTLPMKKPTIIITEADHEKLSRMIAAIPPREREEVRALEAELDRAEIVAPEEVPGDVITMNSRAELLDLDTRERLELTV